MEQIIFGRTNLTVSRTGIGCIPIQRIPYDESTAILRRAYESGVTLFDTAHGYTTSQDRIGVALSHVRDKLVLCTKSGASTPEVLTDHLENSLAKMRTDYIDVFQFHNPSFVPRPGGEDGLYDTLLKVKAQGKIRAIGITAHKYTTALEAVQSGFYDTLQYPFSYLSSDEELGLIDQCRAQNMGILAMKGLCGGLITNGKAAFAFLRQFDNIVPIWGIEKMWQLEEFLACEESPPVLDAALQAVIAEDKVKLSGSFCRACGYCLPCPVDIPIPQAARIEFLMGRMVRDNFVTPAWQENMKRIDNCTGCGHCVANCPYELDVPELLKAQKEAYFKDIYAFSL